METQSDYQVFTCEYCKEETIGFVFWNEHGQKFCSALHRRKAEEARKDAIHQQEMAG